MITCLNEFIGQINIPKQVWLEFVHITIPDYFNMAAKTSKMVNFTQFFRCEDFIIYLNTCSTTFLI